MFVSQSKYDKAIRERNEASLQCLKWQQHASERLSKWNNLIERINSLGGEEFLTHAKIGNHSTNTQFTDAELRSLLQLVHPDKHDGKQSAVTLTQKINQLRG